MRYSVSRWAFQSIFLSGSARWLAITLRAMHAVLSVNLPHGGCKLSDFQDTLSEVVEMVRKSQNDLTLLARFRHAQSFPAGRGHVVQLRFWRMVFARRFAAPSSLALSQQTCTTFRVNKLPLHHMQLHKCFSSAEAYEHLSSELNSTPASSRIATQRFCSTTRRPLSSGFHCRPTAASGVPIEGASSPTSTWRP